MDLDTRYRQLLGDIGLKEPTAAEQEELNGLADRIGLETLEVDANVVRLLDSQRINKILLLRDPQFHSQQGGATYQHVLKRAVQTGLPVQLYLAQTHRMLSLSSEERKELIATYGPVLRTYSSLDGNDGFHDNQDLEEIALLTDLERLSLIFTRDVDKDGWRFLRRLKKLRELELHHNPSVDDETVSYFEDMKHLEILELGQTGVTDACLESIEKMKSLRTLSLAAPGIQGHEFERLMALEGLKSLDVSITPIESLGSLGEHPGLEVIQAFSCDSLTDEGLSGINQSARLRYLSLDFCLRLTDKAIPHLMGIESLEHLDLTACIAFTQEGIERLREHYGPDVIIKRDPRGEW